MRIIHCADIHLDSVLTTNLTKQQANERRNELLLTFTKMAAYAYANDVQVIIIAGDLFDKGQVSAYTRDILIDCINSYPKIDFLYLRGNHDESSLLRSLDVIPENLKLFNDDWTTYTYGNTVITGAEMTEENKLHLYDTLVLDSNNVNIAILHGASAQSEYTADDITINIGALRNKNIDYLALGHYHAYSENELDARGKYVYSGCLEGRGYDEKGVKGFVLIDTYNNRVNHQFVPFAKRTLHSLNIDASNMISTSDVNAAIMVAIEEIKRDDLIEIILKGKVSIEADWNLSYLEQKFQEEYYAFRLRDKTTLDINPDDYRYDISLKGEFIRLVLGYDCSEEDKKTIIQMGLKALAGEEV